MATKSADAFDALYGLVGFKIEDSVNILENGGILIEGNLIKDVDEFQNLKTQFPHLEIHDYGNNLITAGFIDSHMKQNLLDKKPFLIKSLLQARRLFVPLIFVLINKFDE